MNCAECGEQLLEGARFCTACGRRADAAVICPACQTEAPHGAKFCFKCGTALAPQATGAAAPPPQGPPPAPAHEIKAAQPRAIASAPAPAPQRVEPRLDLDKVREAPANAEPRLGDKSARKEPTVQRPAAPLSGSAKNESPPADLRKIWPLGMVVLGVLLGLGAYWSASRDDALAKAEAARRVAQATGPLPTTQSVAPDAGVFSTRQALQGLYGGYDPHLDGAFWNVADAPREWSEWNGKRVFIKPLVSRSDASDTRHVLVTSSVEVRDGLVVKEGAGCPECKSILGAALFEHRGKDWVLVKEQRFLRVAGAWGAPPKVEVDFPGQGGVEVRIENASAGARKSVQAVVLHAGSPARAKAAPKRRDAGEAETSIAAR